jgi:serine phosphatase RsbU (regulator of sigma subunit)
MLEIVAGRLAAELERQVLTAAAARSAAYREQAEQLEDWQHHRPTIAPPLIDGWQAAGRTFATGQPRGDFYSWRLDPEDGLWLMTAAVEGSPTSSMLDATLLRGAVHSSLLQPRTPHQMLNALNEVMWNSLSGHAGSSMFCGKIEPGTGCLHFAAAGRCDAYILRPHGWEPIVVDAGCLGILPDWNGQESSQIIHPGDVLMAVSHRELSRGEPLRRLTTPWLAESLLRYIHLSASELAELASSLLAQPSHELWARAILIVKRTEPPVSAGGR